MFYSSLTEGIKLFSQSTGIAFLMFTSNFQQLFAISLKIEVCSMAEMKKDCGNYSQLTSGIWCKRNFFLGILINAIILWSGILNTMNMDRRGCGGRMHKFSLHLNCICGGGRTNFGKTFNISS